MDICHTHRFITHSIEDDVVILNCDYGYRRFEANCQYTLRNILLPIYYCKIDSIDHSEPIPLPGTGTVEEPTLKGDLKEISRSSRELLI